MLKIKKLKTLRTPIIINHQKKSETALQLIRLKSRIRNSNSMLDKISKVQVQQTPKVRQVEGLLRDILEKEKETKRQPRRSQQ